MALNITRLYHTDNHGGQLSLWVKDPADIAWYQFDWSDFLDAGETITSYTITCDNNLTKLADANSATTVSIHVSGGTNNTTSLVTCIIITSGDNDFKAEKEITIVERISP